MSNKSPLLNIIFQSLNKVTRNMLRDFGEIENLQVSPSSIARFVVKPTSSIISERRTIDINLKETSISTKGRHDPCVGIRGVPVVEAMMACVLADQLLLQRAQFGE